MKRMIGAFAVILAFAGSASAVEYKWTGNGFIEIPSSSGTTPTPAPVVKKTVCGCGQTGDCTCYASTCGCNACGLGPKATGGSGVAAKQAPKPLIVDGRNRYSGMPVESSTTRATPVPRADTPPQPEQGRGSSGATPPGVTYTLVPSAGLSGSTSGCANGNCQGTTTVRRRGIFR